MFTYAPSQCSPAFGTPLSAIRFILQDTIEAEAELADEEISTAYLDTAEDLPQEQRVYRAAALLAGAIYRRYARQVSFSSGGTSVQAGARAELWRRVALELAAAVEGSGSEVIYTSRPATF